VKPLSQIEVKPTEPKKLDGNTMKAIVHDRFGSPDVLELREVERPVQSDARGVLVKVHASSVNPADYYQMRAPFIIRLVTRGGLRKPKDPRLGTDVAGTVEAVSKSVTQFKPGDEVFGVAPGSYAEYATAREDRLALKPANCSFEEAAAVGIAGFTALQALRDKGGIQSGQKVLINGAGGGVGTFAVQIAKSFGAKVTAVTNTRNLDMVRALGADHVIDYAKEDFTRNRQRYDLICDIAAAHSIGSYKRALNPNGTVVTVGFKDRLLARLLYFSVLGRLIPKGGRKVKFFVAKSNQMDLVALKELIETGKVRPVIDKRYPLNQTGQAMHDLHTGQARGKIVITVAEGKETEQEKILRQLDELKK
jgi:NADPH:quinone reductase-like Zn-dependent oxidoreductase